jgi:hypothetical protein
MAIWVTLSPRQLAYADAVGERRQNAAERRGGQHRNNRPNNSNIDLKTNQSAVRCELAAYFGLGAKRWHQLEPFNALCKAPDLDGFIDVKERTREHHHLIVQRDDPVAWAYVSVCSETCPEFCIDFWCWGKEIQIAQYWKSLVDGRPAYCADQWAPIARRAEELKIIVKERHQ